MPLPSRLGQAKRLARVRPLTRDDRLTLAASHTAAACRVRRCVRYRGVGELRMRDAYNEFPTHPHSEMSMMTPSGPLNLASALRSS